jgi:hypothetical protein
MNDPEQIFSCTSRSQAQPAHMSIKPDKNRPLGSWHFTSGVNFAGALFQMLVNTNGGASTAVSTMDITFEIIDNLAGLPLGYNTTTSTFTPGVIGGRNIMGGGYALQGINSL